MKLHPVLASLGLALILSGAAHAQVVQGLDGRWEGAIARPDGSKLTGVFRVETKDGKTTAVFDSPDQGARDIAATVAREGDKVTLGVPIAGMVYNATLSADGKTLSGDVAQGGGAVPLTMTQKPASTAATLTGPAVAGLDGRWEGTLSTPVGSMALAFRVSTAGGRTTTLMDSLDEKITGIPALAARNGQTVKIDVPGISGAFDATLSADGKTLAGFWSQSGQSFDLQMMKK